MLEVEIAECKALDEFREAEGLDLKGLLLTVMPNLEMVNGETLKDEDYKAANEMLFKTSVN
eukprot:CAMPEP_0116955192 /NCGR_PEP_ID=MMETSP0467-20121206/42458_1 /TAXON_ID=283647 /ORGANISM="Mesodinium pulex, Strain SPMC105" /LENGTH=60 /DNA_ID=CAMNT_0004641161 /DNA_START=819 /DNA_END=1001 /DNA_ORIENTATION=-